MYLFFDTETNGLPKSFSAPATDLNNWPRITQIAWQLYDENEKLINKQSFYVKPDGWTIPDEQFFKENGMSTEKCEEIGIPLTEILKKLVVDMENSEYLIAHNIDFDKNILSAEFIRYGIKSSKKLEKFCTMKESTNYCKLKGNYGYKWPKLLELYEKLFESEFVNGHEALIDVAATAKCFFELKKRRVMMKPKIKVHNLKLWPEYFKEVKNGSKKFEVRKNDRDYNVDDVLVLEEYCPKKEEYSGEKILTNIDYILHGGGFGVEKGFVVMSITKK